MNCNIANVSKNVENIGYVLISFVLNNCELRNKAQQNLILQSRNITVVLHLPFFSLFRKKFYFSALPPYFIKPLLGKTIELQFSIKFIFGHNFRFISIFSQRYIRKEWMIKRKQIAENPLVNAIHWMHG